MKKLKHQKVSMFSEVTKPAFQPVADSKRFPSQCPTKSISIFAFRKRSGDILGYGKKFFLEVCTQPFFFYLVYYLNSQRLAIFYIRLGGIHFIQIHHEGGSWGAKYVYLVPSLD